MANHSQLKPWKPGQSGNPNGRPKGSRHKLGEEFVAALQEDFMQTVDKDGKTAGMEVIARLRAEDPGAYVRVVASILPKEIVVKDELSDVSDEDLAALVFAARNALASHTEGGTEASGARSKKPIKGVPSLQ